MKKRRLMFIILSLSLVGIHHVIFGWDGKPMVNGVEVTSKDDSNILWTSLAAFLVFFMQAGFAMVEAGFTRAKNAANI
ncbi:MAG: ammonium transporter, partial [Spirochaetota bacterium]|nr:ammonium transporter [Spirochaetota bacterium]